MKYLDAAGFTLIWLAYFLHAQGWLVLTPEAMALLGSAGTALRGYIEMQKRKAEKNDG